MEVRTYRLQERPLCQKPLNEMEREDRGQKQQEDKGVKRRAMIVERFEHDCN